MLKFCTESLVGDTSWYCCIEADPVQSLDKAGFIGHLCEHSCPDEMG